MKTLEDFLIDQCGMVTPKLLSVFEPHREFVENQLAQDVFDIETMWHFLPEPKEEHFTP